MHTVFIISEYNPFHRGHAWQLEEVRRELKPHAVVAIMSGNFVQRGCPAIFDKFTRADLAIRGGCDLVVELPVIHATSSAEFFAGAGVAIAQGLDPSGILSFGSESGELPLLMKAAEILTRQDSYLDAMIREALFQGMSFPAARARAVQKLTGDSVLSTLLDSPNNILAVEYIRAAIRQKATLSFHTIPRRGLGYHDSPDPEKPQALPSAAALRQALGSGNVDYAVESVPPQCRTLFRDSLAASLIPQDNILKQLIQYRLMMFPESLLSLPEAGDGLGQRILKQASRLGSLTLDEFILVCKTRRFTYTRISRLLLHLALGFDELDYSSRRQILPEYTRILALNEIGRQFLNETRTTRTISLIQSARTLSFEEYRPEGNASKLYSLLNPAYPEDADFRHPVRVHPAEPSPDCAP